MPAARRRAGSPRSVCSRRSSCGLPARRPTPTPPASTDLVRALNSMRTSSPFDETRAMDGHAAPHPRVARWSIDVEADQPGRRAADRRASSSSRCARGTKKCWSTCGRSAARRLLPCGASSGRRTADSWRRCISGSVAGFATSRGAASPRARPFRARVSAPSSALRRLGRGAAAFRLRAVPSPARRPRRPFRPRPVPATRSSRASTIGASSTASASVDRQSLGVTTSPSRRPMSRRHRRQPAIAVSLAPGKTRTAPCRSRSSAARLPCRRRAADRRPTRSRTCARRSPRCRS